MASGRHLLRRLSRRRLRVAAFVALSGVALVVAGVATPGQGAMSAPQARADVQPYRTGHPPTLASAVIDAQRRLVVTYTAPDGMTFGGHVYLDNDPRDAEPGSGDPTYGLFMYCNNKSTCLGRWTLPINTAGTGPFTYTTDPLDCQMYPAGTWYVQLETYNEDPYPSTRQWEESLVKSVPVPACGTAATTTATSGGGVAAPQTVTFTTAASIVHSDGSKEQVKAGAKTVVAPTEVIESAAAPIKLAIKDGRLVLGPRTDLTWSDALGGSWDVKAASPRYAGEVWLSGQHRMLVTVGGTTVVTVNAASVVVVSAGPGKNTVSALKGKVTVKTGSDDATKGTTLTAGFQVLQLSGRSKLSTPKKFKPPTKPFWQ